MCGRGTGVNGAGAACRANSDCASNSCGVAQGTTVYYRSNNCLLDPFETQKDLVHVQVQEQPVGLPTFFMTGQAIFTGTSGTCTSAVCTNTTAVTGVYCSGNANCNWSALQGSGSGSSQLFPAYCGNGVVGDSPGETCDPPASLGGGHCSINPRDLCSGPGTCADFVDTVGGTCPGCIDGTQPECTCAPDARAQPQLPRRLHVLRRRGYRQPGGCAEPERAVRQRRDELRSGQPGIGLHVQHGVLAVCAGDPGRLHLGRHEPQRRAGSGRAGIRTCRSIFRTAAATRSPR